MKGKKEISCSTCSAPYVVYVPKLLYYLFYLGLAACSTLVTLAVRYDRPIIAIQYGFLGVLAILFWYWWTDLIPKKTD